MPLSVAAVAYTHYRSDPRVRREAEALVARGDAVEVWALREEGAPARQELGGVVVHGVDIPRYRGGRAAAYVRSYARFMAQVQWSLARKHQKNRFDIVHVHTMPDFMLAVGLVPRLFGAKLVLDMHDLMPELFALKFGLKRDGIAAQGLRLTQQAATLVADQVIAVHRPQYELLLGSGVPARKLTIVMNAADPAVFAPRKKEPRLKDGAPIRIVYHGTLLERYGVEEMIRAFAMAHQKEPRLQLTILGGGDHEGALRQLIVQLNLQESVTMDGKHLALDEVAAAIRGAHLGLVPGKDDHEDSVLPTKMLEYLAVGIPTIAVKTRTVGHYFSAAESELVPLGDVEAFAQGILRLAEDKARRKELVTGGQAWNTRYGWEANRLMLYQAFDGLCVEKIIAERRKRQKKIDGHKTGTRSN